MIHYDTRYGTVFSGGLKAGEPFPGEFECREFADLWSGEANRKALEANLKHK
jgi:hypothetical protein